MVTRVNDLPVAFTGANALTLPYAVAAIPAPPVTLSALYIPSSWNDTTKIWGDMSGNGNDLPAANAGVAPVPMTESGASFLRFDGTKRLNKATFVVPQAYSAYTLVKMRALPTTGRAVMVTLGMTTTQWLGSINAAGVVLSRLGAAEIATGTTATAPGIDLTTWHTHGMVVNGVSSLADLDANEKTVDWSATTASTAELAVAASNGSSAVAALNADIACIAIAPTALTAQQRIDLRAYLRARAGVA